MSLFAEQYRPDRAGACDPHQLGGNLCRCTGYRPIRDAALSLGPAPAGVFRDRLDRPAPAIPAFRTSGFSRPSTIEECLTILAADPDVKLVAGGTDLAVESNLRASRWRHLVSLESIGELRRFEETARAIVIGAGLPLTEVLARCAVLEECLLPFASPTIRNRATLGGNLGNASPIGDCAPLLMALDAVIHTATGRTIPLSSFFTGYRRTALAADDFIAAIEIPKPLPQYVRFFKASKRRVDDISTVAAGLAISLNDQQQVVKARFAFGGVADRSHRAVQAEDAVIGRPWNLATVALAQGALARTLQPMTDHRGSAAYRLAVAQSLLEKFWHEWREAPRA